MSERFDGTSSPQALPGRARRLLEAATFVAIWMALGFALRLSTISYLLLTIPLTLAFQVFIARRPIRSLWLRDAPAFRFDRITVALTALFLAVPTIATVGALRSHHWGFVPYGVATFAGAVPLAYAARRLKGRETRAALACLATAGVAGTLLFVLAAFAAKSFDGTRVHWRTLLFAHQLLLLLPVTFVVEEVAFRGAIDAHVQAVGERRGWLSALFVSALWGLWHLPISGPLHGAEAWLSRCTVLIVFHTILGVPLSIFWRRSGNLFVPAFTHAWVDAVRNALGLLK